MTPAMIKEITTLCGPTHGFVLGGNAAVMLLTGDAPGPLCDIQVFGNLGKNGIMMLGSPRQGYTRQTSPFGSSVTFSHHRHPFTVTVVNQRRRIPHEVTMVGTTPVAVLEKNALLAYYRNNVEDLHPLKPAQRAAVKRLAGPARRIHFA